MNEAHRENLSALVDGELAFDQVRFMLRRMEHEASLRATWSNYHVGRDCLRGEFSGQASPDFADRVMTALDSVPDTGTGQSSRRWLQWSAGGAIAASVAILALMVARPQPAIYGSGKPGDGQVIAAAEVQNDAASAVARAPEIPRWLAAPSAALLPQRASASTLDGQLRVDTLVPATYQLSGNALIPTAYSRHQAPNMNLREYPARQAANAHNYGQAMSAGWVTPLTSTPDAASVQAH